MGFLKFLKRNKKEELERLDLPPEPPSLELEGFEDGFPKTPNLPDFPEGEISGDDIPMPKFDFPERKEEMQDIIKESSALDFPIFPDIEEKPMAPAGTISVSTSYPEPIPEVPQRIPIEQKSVAPERQLREMSNGRTLYIRVDKFKTTLGSISVVRSNLRQAEEALTKLESIKIAKDKSFDRVRASLDDLQKKLIFVDKTLFKGE